MRRSLSFCGLVAAILLALTVHGAGSRVPAEPGDRRAAMAPRALTEGIDLARIPLQFIPSRGQAHGPAAFSVRGRDKTIHFGPGGLTFALAGVPPPQARRPDRGPQAEVIGGPRRWIVKLDFVDANEDVEPVGLEETGARISYFKGRPERWQTGLIAHSKIMYRDLWPGIDLVYYGTADRLKYEFVVHPGADPSSIKLAYRGAADVSLTPEGRLEVSTPLGGFQDDVPAAWQEVGGMKVPVDMAYALAERAGQSRAYGFDVGDYDRGRPLVLDPAIVVYCGYLGGSDQDIAMGNAVDGQGNVYVTGFTWSTAADFPATVGPDLTHKGDADAFVAKINPDGTALVYCGYIGGSAYDMAAGIAVDGLGNAHITGFTSSTEMDFPVIAGPDLTHNGNEDAFVAKVSPDGTALVYCGYIGGSGSETGEGIAVDGAGSAYVTGRADSTEATFPVAVGPSLTHMASSDAFVAKVGPDGTALVYCGYIGGYREEKGRGIAVDGSGNAYVVGYTSSTESSFPVVVGPGLTYNGDLFDAFVAKVNASGAGLDYCGYIGGAQEDQGYGIAVDGSENAYVVGTTRSTEPSFPVVVGPGLTYNGGYVDAFVAKVNASGAGLDYCGYIGGDQTDQGYAIAVDGSENAYVVGTTSSTESSFPVIDGPDLTHNGDQDAFVAKVSPDGTALVYCGYIGGSGMEAGEGIAVDASGDAFVAGYTWSGEATFPKTVGPDLTFNGAMDAFVARVTTHIPPEPVITSLLPSGATAGEPALTLAVVGTGFVDGAVVTLDGNDRLTSFVGFSKVEAEIAAADLATGKVVQVAVRNPDGGTSNGLEFTIDNPVPALTSLSPARTAVGGAGFTLTLTGSDFVPGSVVRWGGADRATTFVSGTELQAAVAAADIAAAGEVQVTVFNPVPSGGTSSAVAFPVVTFTMGATPASATVTAGQSTTSTVQVTPQHGPFDSEISLSATGLPRGCTASFVPAGVTPGAASASSTLTLRTTARTGATAGGLMAASSQVPPALGFLLLLPAVGLPIYRARTRGMTLKAARRCLAAAALVCLIVLVGGCSADGGGGGTPSTGTPAGTYTITVRGTSGSLTVSTAVTLVVN